MSELSHKKRHDDMTPQIEAAAPRGPLEGPTMQAAVQLRSDAGVTGAQLLSFMGGGGAVQLREDEAQREAPSAQGGDHDHDHDHADGEAPHVDPPSLQDKGAKNKVMEAEAAKKLLEKAFSAYKSDISAGNVKVLAQADFQVAYDAIYGKSEYAWDKYVKPKFGNLNGFAHNNVNYINKDSANVTTVPHEMLHNNAAADWRPFVGNEFDEGATEYLEQHALRTGGINTNLTHYPNQRSVVEKFLASGQSKEQLFTAYLQGGASGIVGKHVDSFCKGSWANVKKELQDNKDWAKAKALLGPKAGINSDWSNKEWGDLSTAQQAHWGVLGWNEASWNNDTGPASESKAWSALSEAERNAAAALGYDETKWNNE